MSKQYKKANNPADYDHMQFLGGLLQKANPGLCFVLLVSPFGEHGMANYVSNGTRTDIIKFMRETADRLEKGQDFKTPDNN